MAEDEQATTQSTIKGAERPERDNQGLQHPEGNNPGVERQERITKGIQLPERGGGDNRHINSGDTSPRQFDHPSSVPRSAHPAPLMALEYKAKLPYPQRL
ncbi:hypothetical protein AHAS_Ahas06G0183900 [Arachis hypogaea]